MYQMYHFYENELNKKPDFSQQPGKRNLGIGCSKSFAHIKLSNTALKSYSTLLENVLLIPRFVNRSHMKKWRLFKIEMIFEVIAQITVF